MIVIPARYASTRLPGKPLRDIAGLTMIERVVTQGLQSSATQVVVATDHPEIAKVLEGKVEVIMTHAEATSGTDRVAEAVSALKLEDETVVVNLQGDEPLMPPACLDQVANNLVSSGADMATLACSFSPTENPEAPDSVKVVFSSSGRALYFSRSMIPFNRDSLPGAPLDVMRHIGLYAYRAGFIKRFVGWPVARIEALEQLEQLRALDHDAHIHVDPANETILPGVDTQEDLDRVCRHFAGVSC